MKMKDKEITKLKRVNKCYRELLKDYQIDLYRLLEEKALSQGKEFRRKPTLYTEQGLMIHRDAPYVSSSEDEGEWGVETSMKSCDDSDSSRADEVDNT